MTAALEVSEWSAARPGRTLPPGNTRYPFYRSLGGSQGRSARSENLVPTGIWSRTVQPVVSHYSYWATRPTRKYLNIKCNRSRRPRCVRSFVSWGFGLESHRGHGYLSVTNVACSQAQISAKGRSLVQRSPTERCVSECDCETSAMRRP